MVGGKTGVYETHTVELPPDTVTGPDDGEIPLKPLERIHIRAGITKATVLDGPVKLDPYLFAPDVKVQDLATVKEEIYSQDRLRFDVNNTFVPGQFYELPQLAMYFCKSIQGDVAHLSLIESFQHGQLIQGEFQQETKYSESYVPVTPKATIERLQRRLRVIKGQSRV
jgi:hypothetical protein